MDTREQIVSKLLEFGPDINKTNREKGFWPADRNKGEQVMLIVSELAECLEAHRKGHLYANELEESTFFDNAVKSPFGTNSDDDFIKYFQADCKNTVEDEMADVVIRALDYVYGWAIVGLEDYQYRKESTDNFGHDLLRLNHYILNAYHDDVEERLIRPGTSWSKVFYAIAAFCEWHSIDIVRHVQWKLRYNKTRAHRHGKAY